MVAVALACLLAAGAPLHAGEVAKADLDILGLGLEVDRSKVTTAVDVPSYVQTIFGGKMNEEAPSTPGLSAIGDLTGPGINTPISLLATPGRKFALPALHEKGEYQLSNIRLVDEAGAFLQQASPSFAIIEVTDVLKTEVRVRQLSAAELRERGITVDARNYDVYEYVVIFGVDEERVEIPYPVIIDKRTHTVMPVAYENPFKLPPLSVKRPPRFVPPGIDEFELGPGGGPPESESEGRGGSGPRLPAAIILPSGFGVLHQFFAVIVQVSNTSPEEASIRLDNITAVIGAPGQMRVAGVKPAVTIGQPVPIYDSESGTTFLIAGAQGQAEWTLEALKAGTHPVEITVEATYQKPGQEEFRLRGKASTAIVVSDPRFQINFSHPDTVRVDENYTAYAFVTNLSAQSQHVMLDMSDIPACSTGLDVDHICRVEGPPQVELDLQPGEMIPVPYKLTSKITGHVFAGAGTSNDEALGVSVKLHMGVSESGIPLSPATLVMPHYSKYLPGDFIAANMQLLGLGYSLATAPLNQYTSKFPRVIKTDVFQRAQEIARAGQRIFAVRAAEATNVVEENRDAVFHLSLDLLGNVERVDHIDVAPELFEWDELRRQEKSGRRAGAAMARELEKHGLNNGRTPQQFVDDFAAATAHRTPFLFAYAHGAAVAGHDRPYAMSVYGSTTEERIDVPAEATTGWVRLLPYAELTRFDAGTERGEMAMVGKWTQNMRVVVMPRASSFTIHFIYPDTNNGSQLRSDIQITDATPGQPVAFELIRGSNTLVVRGANASPNVVDVPQTPLRVLGAAQDLHLNKDARLVSVLFNRPLRVTDAAGLRDQFALTINVPKANYSVTRKNTPTAPNAPPVPLQIPAAALQQDARFINVTFDKGLSSNANYVLGVERMVDMVAGGSYAAANIIPRIDNRKPGGILTGRVLLGDNSAIPGAEVSLEITGQSPQIEVTGPDGRYMYEFVGRDIDNGITGAYKVRAIANQRATEAIGQVRLIGEVHNVDLVFLGRGSAKGRVTYSDGEAIDDVTVTIGSVLFGQFRNGRTDANGYYEIGDLPVGPLTFSVSDEDGRPTFAANAIRAAGQVIEQDLVIERRGFPGTGTVRVTVRRSDTMELVPQAHVGVYTQGYGLTDGHSDDQGFIEFRNVPAGLISVIAAHFGISPEGPGIELDMKADQVVEQTIIIPVPAPGQTGLVTLEGYIERDDPTSPGDRSKDVRVGGAIITIGKRAPVTSNPDGSYAIHDLPLNASGAPLWVFDPATGRKAQFNAPTLQANQINRFTARLSSSDPEGTATIRVRLTSATGAPVNGYRVFEPGFPPTHYTPIGNGVYELKDVTVPIQVEVVAVPGSGSEYGDQMASGKARADFNGQIAIADIRLPGQGTVVTKLELRQVDDACPVVPCYTQAFGKVALVYSVWDDVEQSTKAKTIVMEADPTSQLNTFLKVPAQQTVTVYTDRHPAGFDIESLKLAFEGDLRNVTLRMDKLGDVTGRVFAHDRQTPIPGAVVELQNNAVIYGKKATAPDGSYRFPAVQAALSFRLVAKYVQDGIFRTGYVDGRTPEGGGPASNLTIVMREQSRIEGQVVDDDGNPVPLAYYWARELAWPNTEYGTAQEPMQADINGRFIINNVFTGPFRVSAKDPTVQELRGDYQGTLAFEGDTSQLQVKVKIGQEGTGTVAATVVDSLQAFKLMPNAEVTLFRNGYSFDLGTTDDQGVIFFRELPVGSYSLAAYSKAAGRAGRTDSFTVTVNQTTNQQVVLDFLGKVAGRVTDPESEPVAGAPLRGMPVQVESGRLITRDSTDGDGKFTLLGIPEGTFKIFAYDYETGRMAFGPDNLFISKVVQEHANLELQVEKTAKLTVKAYLPNDSGGPGELAPMASILVQTTDYFREQQGNSLVFPKMITRYGYAITARELGGEERTIKSGGSWAPGQYAKEHIVVFPSTGSVEVKVLDSAGQPVQDAKVIIGDRTIFSPANGIVVATGVKFGYVGVQATKGNVGASASGDLQSRSIPLKFTLNLGSSANVEGFVEAEEGIGVPSVGTRLVVTVTSRLLTSSTRLETVTGPDGKFLFTGIPIGGTRLRILYYGPDDTTIGDDQTIDIPDGTTGTYVLPPAKLDATPPRVLSIDPPTNATNVSPSSPITITFSEPLGASFLTSSYFQLHATDTNTQVAAAVQPSVRPDGTFQVKLIPPAPTGTQRFALKSNVLYRVVVLQGVLDTTGNGLRAAFGSSFTTVNYTEPSVVRITPAETEPLKSNETFYVKFNKQIDITSLDPGYGGSITLERLDTRGGTPVQTIPTSRFLDPADPTVIVVAPTGVAIAEAAFYRLTITGIRDTQTPPNVQVGTKVADFFSYDTKKPVASIVSPVQPGEKLVSQVLYRAGVKVVDEGTTTDSTDVQYVDFYDANGTWLVRDFVAPYEYVFTAPVTDTGTTFTLKVSATDLSNNSSPQSEAFTWEVIPNAPPVIISIVNTPAAAYPTQAVKSVVSFSDEGVEVTAALKLSGLRLNGEAFEQILGSQLVKRTGTTGTWPTAEFNYTLPLDLEAGTADIIASVKDLSKTGTGTAPVQVLDDETPPEIISFLPKAETRYQHRATYTIELQVRDAQTGIKDAQFEITGVNPASIVETRTNDAATGIATFRYTVTVPPKNADTRITIKATATDNRDKTAVATADVIYERVDDVNIPKAEWVSPLDGAVLASNLSNWQATLRIRATDETEVTSVRFESPALAAPETVTTPKSGTTDIFEKKVTLNFPTDGQPFVITAIVSDGDPAHDVELPITIEQVVANAVVSASTSVSSVTVGDYSNKTLVVRGPNVRFTVNVPLTVPNLIVLDGAVVSAFEETKLDLTVTDRLFIDADSRIDVDDKGYLGGLRTREDGGFTNTSRNGRTFGGTATGGAIVADASHGGIGGSWTGTTNATYGSIKDPVDFGAGGGAQLETQGNRAGGNGGGVVLLRGGDTGLARFVIAGTVSADSASLASNLWTGGAGGTVNIRARSLITGYKTRITANGAPEGPSLEHDLGGGGGRIAIRVSERLDLVETLPILQARGGTNAGALTDPLYVDGGAGTIFLSRPGATNGELIVSGFNEEKPTSQHRTAGTPLSGDLTFDAITVGPRALARFDNAYTIPAPEALKVDASALVLSPTDVPQLTITTTPAAGAEVAQSTSIKAFTTVQSTAGVRMVRTVLSVQPTDVVAYPGFPAQLSGRESSISIPASAAPGQTTLKVVVTDRAGRTVESAPVAFTIVNNGAPVISNFTVTPSDTIYANGTINIDATATDDVAVTDLTLASTIATPVPQAATTPTPQSRQRKFTVLVPKTTASGTAVVLTLSATDGFPNRTATTATHTVTVRKDEGLPEAAVLKPSANQTFDEAAGAKFDLELAALDHEVGVQSVKARFEGVDYPMTAVPGRPNVFSYANVPLPSVDGVDPVAKTITFTVTDYEPNTTTVTQTILIRPLIDPLAPTLAWACSSPNAIYPAGITVPLRVSAVGKGSNGVNRVEFSVNGGTPVVAPETSAGSGLYNYNFPIPNDAAPDTVYNVRVAAVSTSDNEATILGSFSVIGGANVVNYPTSSTIDATDMAFEGNSLVVRSGATLVIIGPHTFGDIVVLDGGKLVQRHADLAKADLVTVNRLFVACGGSIDVTALGYTANRTVPGAAASDDASGGSHIGRGGIWNRLSGGVFGSIYEPLQAGGAANLPTATPTDGQGGGAVRVHATSTMTIDGLVRANGASGVGGGAGGSIWLSTAANLSGGGTLEAKGATGDFGPGGGGAIALDYATLTGTLLDKASAAGATTGREGRHAAAGTILSRRAGTDGDLTIDNKGTSQFSATELPSFGSATVTAVPSAGTATLDRRYVMPSLAGNRVRVTAANGTSRMYRIGAVANDPRTFVLDNYVVVRTQDAFDYDGYLMTSTDGIGGFKVVAVRYTGTRWEYDNDSTFTPFVPAAGDFVFASFKKAGGRISELLPLRCNGACGTIEGVGVAEMVTGELAPDSYFLTSPAGPNTAITGFDAAEIAVRGDGDRRGFVTSPGFTAVTLTSLDGTAVALQAGDTLRGIYKFDSVKIRTAKVVTQDLLESTTEPEITTGSLVRGNAAAPAVDASKLTIEGGLRGPVVAGNAGAISGDDAPFEVVSRNTATAAAVSQQTIRTNNYAAVGRAGGLSIAAVDNNRNGGAAASMQTIGDTGYLAFVPSQANREIHVGLAPANTVDTYAEPGHQSFRLLANGTYQVWANAANTAKTGAYTAVTPFRIEKTPAAIRWYVDDVLVHELTAGIPASLLLDVSFQQSPLGEIGSIELVDGSLPAATFHAKVAADGSFTVPVLGAPGDAVVVRARDRHAYSLESREVAAGTIPNNIGVSSVTFAPAEITGGRTSTGTVTLLAPAGPDGALVTLASNTAGVTVPASIAVDAGQMQKTFTVSTAPVAAAVDATITASYGFVGSSGVLKVVKDNVAPAVTVVSPAANAQYSEGSGKIAVQADVIEEDSGVKRVYATFDGQTYEMPKNAAKGANAYFVEITAPAVDGTQPVTRDVVVRAIDNNDNTTLAPAVQVIINPVVDGNVPTVEWRCSSNEAMYPVGYGARLRVYAKAPPTPAGGTPNPLDKVEITVTDANGTATVYPAVSAGTDLYEYVFTIPDVPDGTAYTVRGRAVTVGGGDTSVDGAFTVIKGATEFKSNTTIAATNTTYDNQSIVVWDGVTVTIDGTHTFKRVAVLFNGKIQHSTGNKLAMTAEKLYVGCSGSIDASSRGYLENQTYPGATRPGSYTGGSHIGYGGLNAEPLGSTYGSVYQPSEAGGGGRWDGNGGGVLRIQAGTVAIDGAIRADGTSHGNNASAGGSVWITAAKIAGIGVVTANGGNGDRSGGGGAIALEYTTAAGTLLNKLSAIGGVNGATGGGGSVYVRQTGVSVHGSLTIDNATKVGQGTELPALGSGKALTGTIGAVLATDRTVDVPAYFAGHWVRITSAAGEVKGTWRIFSISGKSVTLAPNAEEIITLAEGDSWQGIYRFDELKLRNTTLLSVDPIETTEQVFDSGTITLSRIHATNMTVKPGAVLRHPTAGRLEIKVSGELRIESGATIDANNLGYNENQTYPGAGTPGSYTGGSHIGFGGLNENPLATTFGSIYRPSEHGGGGRWDGRGGGVIRIEAGTLTNDGTIRANGNSHGNNASAGGSVWVTASHVTGSGAITANGGTGDRSGGGGAIAVEYATSGGTLLNNLSAQGGGSGRTGGAGSIYLHRAGVSVFGDLTIDNGTKVGEGTELPALGSGTAQAATAGAVLATGRTVNVPAYFVGHWVRITSATGTVKGTWRIASVNGTSVTLRPNAEESLSLESGDAWQGVYRFDTFKLRNTTLLSKDPVETTEQLFDGGTLTMSRVQTTNLTLKPGVVVRHPVGGSLQMNIAGELRIEAGAVIDANSLGYNENQTYPGAGTPGSYTAGSHIGYGGLHENPLATTFGSLYRPSEHGGGGRWDGRGGGVIRIQAGTVTNDGTIRANGTSHGNNASAGGSIWITATNLAGNGLITALGGNGDRSGGGGAIALEYTSASSTLLANVSAQGGGSGTTGGAGSIYLRQTGVSTYGTVLIDNGTKVGQGTELPSLGSGIAQSGTSGATLATGRTVNVPAYFVGHWVRVTDAAGEVKGTWRIASVNGTSVTLAPNGQDIASLQAGDAWQGIYRFDSLELRNTTLLSVDPVETTDQIFDKGTITLSRVQTTNLTIRNGVVVKHPVMGRVDINVTGQMTVEAGAIIDANSLGYNENQTYPGAGTPGSYTAGSHLGYGGLHENPLATTFGSVYRPAEHGGGGRWDGRGGGVIRIQAGTLTHDGIIRANGTSHGSNGSAGGSVWITANSVGGNGTITANGGNGDRSGGGGAIAVEYNATSGTVISTLRTYGGTSGAVGGAGTIYLKPAGAVFGNLLVDNGGRGGPGTGLPTFGSGTATAGTAAGVVTTSRTVNIPQYFVGHWVEVSSPDGTLKGTWRIASIAGTSFTLAPNASESVNVLPGDSFQGVYRFDNVTLRTNKVAGGDALRVTGTTDKGSTVLDINDGPPTFPAAKRPQIVVESSLSGDAVTGPFGAVLDASTPVKLTVTNVNSGLTYPGTAAADGSFRVPVVGAAGDTFTIFGTDAHQQPLTSVTIPVNGTIVELNTIASFAVQPATVAGGDLATGVVRLSSAARAAGVVVTLSSSSALASFPASVTIPGGATSVQFPINTTSPATSTEVAITATVGSSTKAATFTITASAAALIDVTLSSATVEGGNSVNGTVLLGAPAPEGGALVMLSSTAPEVSVPESVVVPQGVTQASFTVTTKQVGAPTNASINATWGTSESADLALTACATMATVTAPAASGLTNTWFDDAGPNGSNASGDAAFDATRVAFGSASLHFSPPTATQVRTHSFSGGTSLPVTANDRIAVWALVNPCKPPRQILMTWGDGTATYRASWGESRIDNTLAHIQGGAIPRNGEWVRLEVLTKALGITANKTIVGMTISVDGGEVWFDAGGVASTATAKAAKPEYLPNERVWFDDAYPAGAAVGCSSAPVWEAAQVASGNVADMVIAPRTDWFQHCFTGATDKLKLSNEEVIVAYVFLDPANPPREVMLQFHDEASGWTRRAYWGEDVIAFGSQLSVERRRMGALPEAGKWVRLEVPVSGMVMSGRTINGIAFTLYDGRAWFDRVGRVSRVNVALGKTAKQSSTKDDNAAYAAGKALDAIIGVADAYSHTKPDANAWWEVDLGAVYPIDTIDIHNIVECCQGRLANSYIFVSDEPFTSQALATTLTQPGVTAYYYREAPDQPSTFDIGRTGRYVRVQLNKTDYLHMTEVQVWTPASEQPMNVSGGRAATQSSTQGDLIAAQAVNGNLIRSSHAHTNSQLEAWWQLDLGSVQPITAVDVANNYDAGSLARMNNFYLFVSDKPFESNTVAGTLAQAGVSAYYRGAASSSPYFWVGRTGQYIRLQLTGTNYMHPMEVKVISPARTLGAYARPAFDFATAGAAGEPADNH